MFTIDALTQAELLLFAVDLIKADRNKIDLWDNMVEVDDTLAKAKTAFDFSKRPKGFQLRAIVENWDYQRIVREMY